MEKVILYILCLTILLKLELANAQRVNYSDGIESLTEVKSISEDLARAIKLEWDHESLAFGQAQNIYNNTKRAVDNMIATFDARIRSGEKISEEDVQRYVSKATESCEALSEHYNQNSASGGTNSLFGIGKILVMLPELVNNIMGAYKTIKEHQIQIRLERMHAAFDTCRLVDWEEV